ncbi:metal-dependent hydrolase [Parendozoicomonas haliclonae]|uniref:Inner membrane protein n=1 Tax=Parendozoicomonas haliclonae TaxID=1960125 RepID=A0A1X7ALM1_9GAMM|nr:metal-dependent hydrolase [Parendozoicomonas haliclonae]SMA48320.1 hypothetical protein EHSB41UT_02692 [Parendozoicomonas haliclonae]
MDSITQAALGASVAAVVAGKRCNGKVLIAGALLGTLPDLDVLINYGNDISNTVKHRGFSHSLLVLPPFSLLLAWLIHRFRPVQDWSFTRVFMLILLVLVTHPLLDYFTNYGTQLLWPFQGYYALSSIFIIDPLYTLPLLIALGFGIASRYRKAARYSAIALVLSTGYLGWSLISQGIIKNRVENTLQALGLPQEKVFITPTPLNTVLWRVVVLDGNSYWEGLASLFDEDDEVRFIRQLRGEWPLEQTPTLLNDLRTFTHDFVSYQQDNGRLVVSDLRIGVVGSLAFRFEFATQGENQSWQLHTPTRLDRMEGMSIKENLGKMKERLLGDQAIDAGFSDCGLCTSISAQNTSS